MGFVQFCIYLSYWLYPSAFPTPSLYYIYNINGVKQNFNNDAKLTY